MAEKDLTLRLKADSDNAKKSVDNLATSFKKLRSEVLLGVESLGRIAKSLSKLTNYSDELTTSQRLLNVVLGENTEQASRFVKQLSEMSGINESALTKQIASFSQLGLSLGLTGDYAEKLGENLSILSTKLAMLYNTNYDSMSNLVLRAVKGTQQSLTKTTGIYATETNMQAILLENGINREISSLNEGEMAILRYAAITRMVTNDMSAYQDAVNSLAWQKQILTAQITRLATAIGQLLTPVFEKLYIVANAVLMVITEIIKFIGKLVGVSIDVNKSTQGASASYGGLANNIEKASNAAKKSLRPFDKLNNITTPTEGSGSAGGGFGIDSSMLGLLDDANEQLLDIENKATQIRDRIMEWLGFTKDVNGEWKFSKITFGTILGVLVGAGGIIWAVMKVVSFVKLLSGLFKGFKALVGVKTTTDALAQIGGTAAATKTFKLPDVKTILKGLAEFALIVGGVILVVGVVGALMQIPRFKRSNYDRIRYYKRCFLGINPSGITFSRICNCYRDYGKIWCVTICKRTS